MCFVSTVCFKSVVSLYMFVRCFGKLLSAHRYDGKFVRLHNVAQKEIKSTICVDGNILYICVHIHTCIYICNIYLHSKLCE
jgi:hypothetical protein